MHPPSHTHIHIKYILSTGEVDIIHRRCNWLGSEAAGSTTLPPSSSATSATCDRQPQWGPSGGKPISVYISILLY